MESAVTFLQATSVRSARRGQPATSRSTSLPESETWDRNRVTRDGRLTVSGGASRQELRESDRR